MSEAVFFYEGPGYLYLGTLGHGWNGYASLVRSCKDNGLYVRKEEVHWTRFEYPSHTREPPQEIEIALAIKQISGVCEPYGWTRWVDVEDKKFFDVTYWEYCDLGDLESTVDEFNEQHSPLPDVWIATWFADMLLTMTKVHKAGVVHRDAHMGNWLLKTSDSGAPKIMLADFGNSKRREDFAANSWAQVCRNDFLMILECMYQMMGIVYYMGPNGQVVGVGQCQNSPLIKTYIYWLSDQLASNFPNVTDLHNTVMQAQEILKSWADYHRVRWPPAPLEATPRWLPFAAGVAIPQVEGREYAFKQWELVRIIGNDVAIQPDGPCKTLQPIQGNHAGAVGDGARAAWHVHWDDWMMH